MGTMIMKCNINLQNYDYVCDPCDLCSPKSKGNYPFNSDLDNSKSLVNELVLMIEASTPFKCKDPVDHRNPDIVVFNPINNELICRVEAKMLGSQAFMMAQNFIGLMPKEALVIDEPKFLHYLHCKRNDPIQFTNGREVPIFIVWQWLRPCPDIYNTTVFQEISTLEPIYVRTGGRQFQRRVANNDFANGRRLGVIDKIHFSMKECLPIEQLIPRILDLIN
ncbi:hypothetical protein [Acinetobacter sp. Marseille-Q1618]|uniref:hypothetical protein n=1 Tax=Acinetobacter sp. Marseille-Q1618 TaxID=2697502 RepID=UPI00156D9D42|nr:hypothetical protein [Acinetobacter sp. Marseille-Q1618]